MKTPAISDRFKVLGIEPVSGTRVSFNQLVNDERARLAAIVKSSDMKED